MEGSAMGTSTGLDLLNEIASSLRDKHRLSLTDHNVRFGQGKGWVEVRKVVMGLRDEELGVLIAADPDKAQHSLRNESVRRFLSTAETGFGMIQCLTVMVIMRRIQRLCEITSH
jgi:hypothetical protein